MKLFNIAAILLGLTVTFSASAHISLKQSAPASAAMLMQSPEKLELTFSGEVRLAKVLLQNENDQSVDFDFTPTAKPSTDFSWLLPDLEKGNYSVKWIAMGADGHAMSGTFKFMLHSH